MAVEIGENDTFTRKLYAQEDCAVHHIFGFELHLEKKVWIINTETCDINRDHNSLGVLLAF